MRETPTLSMNDAMSVMGQERTLTALDFMSAFGGKADVIVGKADIELAGLQFCRLITQMDYG